MNPAEFQTLADAEQKLWWFRGMQRILFEMVDPIAAKPGIRRVLEAGCGTGYFAKLLQERYGWRVFPIDLAWEGISRAARSGDVDPAQANVAACPFPAGCFDAVFSLDVMVHFPRGEEARAMHELARVLAPGGLLVVRVAALDILRSRHSQFAHERQRFTKARLVQLARDHGIEVIRCTYANSLLMPVALAKFRIWEPLRRSAPASGTAPVPRWLDHLLYTPLALEAEMIRNGADLPYGQSLILLGRKMNT